MVSKIAVMALVAVVAVPILLGYGLNIKTETYSGWDEDGPAQNLTNYLASIEDASKRDYTTADIYQFNSDIFYTYGAQSYPIYEKISTTRTPVKLAQQYFTYSSSVPLISMSETYSHGIIDGGYDASNYYSITLVTNGRTVSYDHLKAWFMSVSESVGEIDFAMTEPGPNGGYLDAGAHFRDVTSVSITATGSPPNYQKGWLKNNTSSYADISKGYRLNLDFPALTGVIEDSSFYDRGFMITTLEPSGICKDIILTFNLNSITESDYVFGLDLDVDYTSDVSIYLKKSTVGGVVQWYYKTFEDSEYTQLYFNPDLAANTYQLYLTNYGGEFRYVGAWPDTIAPAPVLKTYPFTFIREPVRDYIFKLDLIGKTPVMRVDYASVAAYEYKIIRDTTYNPYDFKTNPVTKLTYVMESGPSLVFGGNTYTVTEGKITVNDKDISLNGIKLSSVFTGNSYENTINGEIVSNTLTPSSITFNGDWSMQVNTVAQKYVEKETTSWVPGHFAWQGMDTNFIIAGLLTSVGAFIMLGLYAFRTGARVLPLMLVCGGAAFMFILMI